MIAVGGWILYKAMKFHWFRWEALRPLETTLILVTVLFKLSMIKLRTTNYSLVHQHMFDKLFYLFDGVNLKCAY